MESSNYENELDFEFSKSTFINFFPFVGCKYKDISPKIMVLGESHYINPNIPEEDLTEELLKELNQDRYSTRSVFFEDYFPNIRENGTHPCQHVRCYRYTAAMITGKEYHKSDYIWDYLSFYNFFQIYVGKGSKGKKYINEKSIENSGRAYFDVINILKPELIIAWGNSKLFEWVPQDDYENIDNNIWLYKYKSLPDTKIWHIPHPSQGFSYEWFNEEFLRIVKCLDLDISKILIKE